MRVRLMIGMVLLALMAGGAAWAKFPATEIPLFKVRAHVVSINGAAPTDKKFTFALGGTKSAVTGGEWTTGLEFKLADAEATLGPHNYPNIYLGGWPVVTGMDISGVIDTTVVEGEFTLNDKPDAAPVKFTARMYGSRLGLLVWRDADKTPHVLTMADYNQRYWTVLKSVKLTEAQKPKHFPIVDRYIGGDSDRRSWEEALGELSKAGFSALMMPGDKTTRDMLLQVGIRRTASGIYNPPGYAFDFTAGANENTSPAGLERWAKDIAKPFADAGYLPEDMAAYAMSDEPGWYYPGMLRSLEGNATALTRFHDFLKAQGLTPKDLGTATWEDVKPLGRSQAMDVEGKPADITKRRLFYWTMRFFPWDSSRHFALSTRALEQAFYPNLPIFTNFNFFSGRLYVPGPVANNGEKTSQDAAMGGHDWLEFGRLRGATMLWTEDWFGDESAPQWSFYCAKLRCAADKGGVQFGGYVIPRTAGSREDGILQKILTVIGSGGKGLKYFVFGPEYNFPTNCYSENVKVLPKMAEAHGMIGTAEDLLWPGKLPKPQVAILHPRSAEMWDCKNESIPNNVIYDATNTNLNGSTVDYMAEIFNLYTALQHANIPADFIEEEDLTPARLAAYKVLYVTEPNIPAEFQKSLLQWVQAGGTVVTVSGAGAADRYNDSCDVLAKGLGISEQPYERFLMKNLGVATEAGKGSFNGAAFSYFGPAHSVLLAPPAEGVLAAFADGAPAVIQKTVGQGTAIHFTWFPGLSYRKSQNGTQDKLPVGFSTVVRDLIVYPTKLAKVTTPVAVNVPMIETPMILSNKGAAVTLLNWTGEKQTVTLTAIVPFKASQVTGVKAGKLAYKQVNNVITCTVPLGAADIVMIRP